MARIIPSPLISNIKGSIGGVTFQHSQGGTSVRIKPAIPSSRSGLQNNLRLAMQLVVQSWPSLSSNHKAAWASLRAQLNKNPNSFFSGKWSAKQLFTSYNMYKVLSGLSILASPSIGSFQFNHEAFNIAWDGTYLFAEPEYTGVQSGIFYFIMVSAPFQLAINARFYKTVFMAQQTAPIDQPAFNSAYIANFGAIPPENYFVNYHIIPIHSTMILAGQPMKGTAQVQYL